MEVDMTVPFVVLPNTLAKMRDQPESDNFRYTAEIKELHRKIDYFLSVETHHMEVLLKRIIILSEREEKENKMNEHGWISDDYQLLDYMDACVATHLSMMKDLKG
jgi:hypothetical protein